MPKRVLDIGNCAPDHGAISNMIQTNFGAQVDQANAAEDALPMLEKNDYDLVVVNRLLDMDGSSGMDVMARVQQAHDTVPVMLISNFDEYQAAAVAAGAVPGFGKNAVNAPETIERLSTYLQG